MKKFRIIFLLQMLFIVYSAGFLSAEEADERRFNISGFMDFQYQYPFNFSNNSTIGQYQVSKPHYNLNNINLYFSFNLDPFWLAFAEIKFLFAPSGLEQTVNGTPAKTYPVDSYYRDNQYMLSRYNSIGIERAYIEWSRFPFASVRVGRYLTPFGIWSQDHGAPALTSIRVPFVVNSAAPSIGMPSNQTGVELVGKVNIPGINTLVEYILYNGNGMTNTEATSNDVDTTRSWGCFLNLKPPTIAEKVDLEIGGSAYTGMRSLLYFRQGDVIMLQSQDYGATPFAVYDSSNNQYLYRQTDTILVGHAKLSVRSLPLDGEFVLQFEILQQWAKEDKNSKLVDQTFQPRSASDYKYSSFYIQAEYKFFSMLTPYFRYERNHWDTKDPMVNMMVPVLQNYTVGLNYKPIPRIALKVEWAHVTVSGTDGYTWFSTTTPYLINNNMDVISASVSAAF
jgi:hypothetical protein